MVKTTLKIVGVKLIFVGSLILGIQASHATFTPHPCQEDEFVSYTGTCVHGDTIEMEFGDGVDRPHSGSQGV